MKKLILFLINLIGISFYAHALIISEIMYDPQGSDTGREWVEVYNDTGSSIDLSSWKFNESGTNHGLVASQGGTNISAGGYAVIADNPTKFLLDYPTFSGILFDSSFSLSNSGELIVIKDGSGAQIDSVNYSASIGGNDDGSTLSFISGSWMRGQATPSSENIFSALPVVATSTSEITLPHAPTSAPGADITFISPEDKIVVAGADANFTARAITSDKKQIDGLTYAWNFGDGGSRVGKNVTYHYSYPGIYIVYIDGQSEHIAGNTRIKVRVVNPDVEILNSGNDEKGAFVDLKNNSTSDMDISQWFIETEGLRYPLPLNTILSAKNITRFSGKAVGFSCATNTVRLLFPDGGIVAIKNQNATSTASTTADVVATSTSSTLVSFPRRRESSVDSKFFARKEIIKPIKVEEVTTTVATSTIKIVSNKNTGIADWLRKLFSW